MSQVVTPESIKPMEKDYKPQAWEAYSFMELGNWVHNLALRSTHRPEGDKKEKDLFDAQAYLDMMQAKLNALKTQK